MDKENPSIVISQNDEASSQCDPMSFVSQMAFSDATISRLPHSTRLLSVDEVISLVTNANKKEGKHDGFEVGNRFHRIASADGDMSGQGMMDEYSDITSDGTLSRCTSTDRISLADGQVEDRFRVDRRKLEAMILGCPPDPCDFEIMRLPIGSDGRILSADDFFARVMSSTATEIRYPRLLKVGARNRKDPHVRVVGTPENVSLASCMVRQQLEPHNKITMKMDVSWTHHSHIIGKAGNTIQPVVRRTGVSIHFPDGNKSNEQRKSNQVSINSRGEELSGLEEARASIRQLTPLIFTFSLHANANYISITEPNLLVQHVQTLFNVQVELSVTGGADPMLLGSVRGSETDVTRVKEATLTLLQYLCGDIATHMTVQMKMEVSPQHHAFILGRNNETLKKIMSSTATDIRFPDSMDSSLAYLQKSTVTISGAIENVYAARQNIVGALPLVLMFEVGETGVTVEQIAQVMQTLSLSIIPKPVRPDGRRPVIIKAPERDAGHIYEAWKLVTRSDKKLPTVMIPPSYHIAQSPGSSLSIGGGPCQLWGAAPHPRTSSTSLSPHPFSHLPNLPSPFTPGLPSPAPVFPGLHSPMLGGISPLWGASAAPPVTPNVATSFPFPAPPGMLYDRNNNTNSGGTNFFSSTSLANIAALSNLAAANSPNFGSNNNHFFPSNNPTTQHLASSLLSSNNNYFASQNKNSIATNTNAFLGNNVFSTCAAPYSLNENIAAAFAADNQKNNMTSQDILTEQLLQQQSYHPQLQQLNQQLQQHMSLEAAAGNKTPCREDVESPSGGGSSSHSGGVCSPSFTSPNDSSPRDSSPDMVVVGHIHSPPVVNHRPPPQSLTHNQPFNPASRFSSHRLQQHFQQLASPAPCGSAGVCEPSSPELVATASSHHPATVDSSLADANQRSRDLSSLLSEFSDWRAPGCEKGLQQAMQKLSISDYEAKQILANKAMREPVGGTVRKPTSDWSGYGFSKSSPSYQMREQFQQVGLLKKTVDRSSAVQQHWLIEDGDSSLNNIGWSNRTTGEFQEMGLPQRQHRTNNNNHQKREEKDLQSGDKHEWSCSGETKWNSNEVGNGNDSENKWNNSEDVDNSKWSSGNTVTEESKWTSNDGSVETKWSSTGGGSSPGSASASRSGDGNAVDSGLAASITSSNQASLSLSDPESSDGLANSGSSGCSYNSTGSAAVPSHESGVLLPRLSTSGFNECVGAARHLLDPLLSTSAALLDLPAVLLQLNLPAYIDVFNAQEVDLAMFLSLDDRELKELGITTFGHRKRLLIAIKKLTNSLPELSSNSSSSLKPSEHISQDLDAATTDQSKTVTWKIC